MFARWVYILHCFYPKKEEEKGKRTIADENGRTYTHTQQTSGVPAIAVVAGTVCGCEGEGERGQGRDGS